jgi:NAD-dependent deacetylase
MNTIDRHALKTAISLLKAAKRRAVLTGAGISAESGVPTFRGQDGLWAGRRPEEVATPEAFARDPADVWEFYRWRLKNLAEVQPNAGHRALAKLERESEQFWLITQNVDGLHRAAGSENVIEVHGTVRAARCSSCSFRCDTAEVVDEELPKCPECRALLRPAVVWFGEMLPQAALAAAQEAIRQCDLMLVVGTSGVVQPAASFADWAKDHGARVIEINIERTPISLIADVTLLGKSGEILPELVGR